MKDHCVRLFVQVEGSLPVEQSQHTHQKGEGQMGAPGSETEVHRKVFQLHIQRVRDCWQVSGGARSSRRKRTHKPTHAPVGESVWIVVISPSPRVVKTHPATLSHLYLAVTVLQVVSSSSSAQQEASRARGSPVTTMPAIIPNGAMVKEREKRSTPPRIGDAPLQAW